MTELHALHLRLDRVEIRADAVEDRDDLDARLDRLLRRLHEHGAVDGGDHERVELLRHDRVLDLLDLLVLVEAGVELRDRCAFAFSADSLMPRYWDAVKAFATIGLKNASRTVF